MKSSSAHTAAQTVIRWLRWAAVVALVYAAWVNLAYFALGKESWAVRPAPLSVLQEWVGLFLEYTLRETAFVGAGALIAPRARLAIAVILAAARVPSSFWAHVLSTGGPWWFWTINYTHFSLETFGSAIGVIYIFWLAKGN